MRLPLERHERKLPLRQLWRERRERHSFKRCLGDGGGVLEGVGRAFYLDLTKVWCSLHKRASQAHIIHCTLHPHNTEIVTINPSQTPVYCTDRHHDYAYNGTQIEQARGGREASPPMISTELQSTTKTKHYNQHQSRIHLQQM